MTLSELQNQVANLPPKQFEQFRRWFHEFENSLWDREIEFDAASGRFDALAEEAVAAFLANQVRPL